MPDPRLDPEAILEDANVLWDHLMARLAQLTDERVPDLAEFEEDEGAYEAADLRLKYQLAVLRRLGGMLRGEGPVTPFEG